MFIKRNEKKKLKLNDYTWYEVQDYLKNNKNIIIPVGTCEQHSKHLPLNTDTLVAEYFADYLSQETGTIVAPSINYGVNLPCDRYYCGTTSISQEILHDFLLSITDWWKFQGFRNFFVLTFHGDPFHIQAMRDTDNNNIHLLELFEIDYANLLDKQRTIKHACEAETSVMMHLFPDKVRKDKLEDFETPIELFMDYLYHKKTDQIDSSPGCQGYPSYATKEKGEILVKRMKKNALDWIKAF